MAIGTTAALIGLGIATAGKAVSDIHATNKAVSQQQKGTDAAMAESRRMWGIQQENAKPYMENGRNSANLLGRLMVPGVSYNDPRYGGPPEGMMAPNGRMSAAPGAPMPRSSNVLPFNLATNRPTSGGMGAAMLGPGAMIKLQAPGPNGEVKDVPAHMAGQLIAKGARRVG